MERLGSICQARLWFFLLIRMIYNSQAHKQTHRMMWWMRWQDTFNTMRTEFSSLPVTYRWWSTPPLLLLILLLPPIKRKRPKHFFRLPKNSPESCHVCLKYAKKLSKYQASRKKNVNPCEYIDGRKSTVINIQISIVRNELHVFWVRCFYASCSLLSDFLSIQSNPVSLHILSLPSSSPLSLYKFGVYTFSFPHS